MQPAALILLVIYAAAALVLIPREVQFLAAVPAPTKGWFIFQDIMLQVCILLVLLPSAMSNSLTLVSVTLVMTGFTLLWLVVAWMAITRRRYINRLLDESHVEGTQLLEDLSRRIRERQEKEEPGD